MTHERNVGIVAACERALCAIGRGTAGQVIERLRADGYKIHAENANPYDLVYAQLAYLVKSRPQVRRVGDGVFEWRKAENT